MLSTSESVSLVRLASVLALSTSRCRAAAMCLAAASSWLSFSRPAKKASSVWSPCARRRKWATREAICRTGSHDEPSASAQSSCFGRPRRVSVHAAWRGRICFVVWLWSVVNEASALTTLSRATSRPRTAATHAEISRPWRASAVGFGPAKRRSSACEKAESAGPQATSNILGAAAAAADAVASCRWRPSASTSCWRRPPELLLGLPVVVVEEKPGVKAGRPWRSRVTEERTMSSRSRWKASALRRSGLAPMPRKTEVAEAPPLACFSRFRRCWSSSSSEMGVALMRSKMASRKASSRSLPSQMPRLLRRNASLVMRRSSLMAGLWRSVWSMMTEKARTKATSALGKTLLLSLQ
mmetsp:Transcript_3652/g.11231  ORF Transcript_3652/g.11231 Transcript_3652/m.11231 type:complete len:354 (+) Transcript_3652:2892-3953(+)